MFRGIRIKKYEAENKIDKWLKEEAFKIQVVYITGEIDWALLHSGAEFWWEN